MEILLSTVAYGALIASVVVPALLLVFIVHRFRENMRRKTRIRLFALILTVEIAALGWLSQHPIFVCPAELRPFVSQEEQENIISVSAGPYNAQLPILPLCVVVESADGEEILFRIHYWPLGSVKMSDSKDGLWTYPLFS